MTTAPLRRDLIANRSIYIIAGILVALMIVGSLFDHAISQNLFNPSNAFGIFFAAYGEAPAFLAWVAAGALFIRHRNRDNTSAGVTQVIGAVLLLLIGTATTAYIPTRYLTETPVGLVVAIGVVLAAGTFIVTWHLSAHTGRRIAIRVAVVLLLVPIIELIVVNLIKIVWERPRMRMLVDTPDAGFVHWWLPGYDGRDALMATGIVGEEFKSFPSGHTANGAVAMLLSAFAVLKPSLRPRADLLLWIGFVWALMVALSRIFVGAHFVTDVTVGLAITFITIVLAYRIAFGKESAEV